MSAHSFGFRSPEKATLPRRKFTSDEDVKLRSLVERLGTKSWEEVARFIPDRTARQCRDRYNNNLLDSLVTDPWTPEEDAVLIQQYRSIGPKWVEIGKILSGRSGNNVKNRWHKHLCKVEGTFPRQIDPAPDESEAGKRLQPVGVASEFEWSNDFGSADGPFSMQSMADSGFSFEDSLFYPRL
jgi:hypothetical protein